MKGVYQKLALVAGVALLVVFAAYYFKSSNNNPSVTRDTGLAPAPDSTPDDTRPIGVMPPTRSAPGANWPADQHPSTLGQPTSAQALTSTPGPAPAAGPALAQATPSAGPDAASSMGGPTTMPSPAGPNAFAAGGSAATQPTSTAPAPNEMLAAPTPRTYTIKSGDTFGSIAQQIYHSSARAKDIAQANPLVDPIKLKIGQVIKLPETGGSASSETAAPRHPADAGEAAVNQKTYVVKDGDTLRTIARELYHDRALWKLIYSANRKTIGDSPNNLEAGMKLVIPPQPKASHAPPGPPASPSPPASQDSN